MKNRLLLVGLILSIALLSVSTIGADGVKPPQSHAYGKSLGEWMKLYWTWALGGDQEGNVKKVVFLPLPAAGPVDEECPFYLVGVQDFTLRTGEKFVLPMFVWIDEGENDPPPKEFFASVDVLLKLDGNPIIDSDFDDVGDFFFAPQYFDPPIGDAIFVTGIGFVHGPLPKGEHTLTLLIDTGLVLDAENPKCTLVYDNTWNITVE